MNARRPARYTFAVSLPVVVLMLRTLRSVLLVSSISLVLAACGNKGPLVLPDKAPEQQDKDKKKDQPANATPPAPKAPADGAASQH